MTQLLVSSWHSKNIINLVFLHDVRQRLFWRTTHLQYNILYDHHVDNKVIWNTRINLCQHERRDNQVMLTFCLRVTPIVCRRFQYLEMGKWKWVQQKVMDKIFNRNYVSVIIIINFINLRYLWTIPWTSLLFLSSRILATSPRNSTSLACSYHCSHHYHCHVTLSLHLSLLLLPW